MMLFGGVALIAYVPLLAIGAVLFGRIGVSSQSSGADALERIAAAGDSFGLMNALFHLGTLLLVPGIAALSVGLAGGQRTGWVAIGAGFGVLGVIVAAGFVFSLSHGLFMTAQLSANVGTEARAAYGAAADMNLKTQAGAELIQSVGMGLFALFMSVAILASTWPGWLGYLGIVAGIGLIVAGLASVLSSMPVAGQILGALGGLGLVAVAAWFVAVGIHLISTAATA